MNVLDEDLLRTFAAVCRAGSITSAAADLHLSQPAVSRRIAHLEADVGAPLFDRVPDGMRVSAAGEALRPFAEAAVAAIDDGRRAVRSVDSEDRGPLHLAMVGTLAGSWITMALRRFRSEHPAVDVVVQTANSNEVVELVRRSDATFGIGYSRSDNPTLDSRVLFEERLVVVAAADHRRAGRNVRSLRALRSERWFAFGDKWPRTETNARYVAGLLAVAEIPAEQIQLIDSLTAQKRLVEAGFGIALMPVSSVDDELRSGTLATIPTRQSDLATRVVLTTRAGAYLTHAARRLLDALVDAGRRS